MMNMFKSPLDANLPAKYFVTVFSIGKILINQGLKKHKKQVR